MAEMGTELERHMETLKKCADKMAERKGKLLELREEQAAAQRLHGERILAREKANEADNAAQGGRLAGALNLLGATTGLLGQIGLTPGGLRPEQVQQAPGNGEFSRGSGQGTIVAREVVAQAAPIDPAVPQAPAPTPPAANATAPTPPAVLFPDSGGQMDKVNYGEGDGAGDDDMSSSDDDGETTADTELNGLDLEDWKEHMAAWVFQASHGEAAPTQLVRVFCGDGEGKDETAAALGAVVDKIRNDQWAEIQGEAKDIAKIQAIEATGDMAKAYSMRQEQGQYAMDRYKQMRAQLFAKLDIGLNDLKILRQAKVDDGTFVAATGIRYKLKKREGAAGAKGVKKGGKGTSKGSADKDTKPKKLGKKDTVADKKNAAASVAAAKAKVQESVTEIKAAVGDSAQAVAAEASLLVSAN